MHRLDLSALYIPAGRDVAMEIINGDPLITDGQREGFARVTRDPSSLLSDVPSVDGFQLGDLLIDVMARAPHLLFTRYREMALAVRRFSPHRPAQLLRSMPPLMMQSRLPDPGIGPCIEAGYEHLSLGKATRSGDIVVFRINEYLSPAVVRHMSGVSSKEAEGVFKRVALIDPRNGYVVMEGENGLGEGARAKISRLFAEAFPGQALRAVPVTFQVRNVGGGDYVMEAILPTDRPLIGPFERHAYGAVVHPDRIVVEIGSEPRPEGWAMLFEYAEGFVKSGIRPQARPLVRIEAEIAPREGALSVWGMLQLVGGNRRKYADTSLIFEGASKLYTIGNMPNRRGAGPLSDKDFPAGARRAFFVAGPKARDFSLALWHFLEGREYDSADYGIEAKPEGHNEFMGIKGIVRAERREEPTGGGGGGPVCACHDFDPVWEAKMISTTGFAALVGKPPIIR